MKEKYYDSEEDNKMVKTDKPDRLEKLLQRHDINSRQLGQILRYKDKPDELSKILEKYKLTKRELEVAIQSADTPKYENVALDLGEKHVKLGYFSDPHIGHEKFREDGFDLMRKYFRKEGVDFVITPGDNLEGMSGRPGHVYELTHVGFTDQADYATQLYDSLGKPIFGIDGNHDQWFYKKNNGGVVVGKELENRVKNYTNLGQDEADLQLIGPDGTRPVTIKLFHGSDGTAYADSYKIQKLIESLSGGEKPEMIFSGHYHKSLYLARRNVHGFEAGTLCGQSRFMRGKKIQAHQGFGIVDIYFQDRENDPLRIRHEWVPLYDRNDVPKLKKVVKVRTDTKK